MTSLPPAMLRQLPPQQHYCELAEFDFRKSLIVDGRMTLLARAVYELLGYEPAAIARLLRQHQSMLAHDTLPAEPSAWIVHAPAKLHSKPAAAAVELIMLDHRQIVAAIDSATWLDIDTRVLLKVDLGNHPMMSPEALICRPCIAVFELTKNSYLNLDGYEFKPDYTAYAITSTITAASSMCAINREPVWAFFFESIETARFHHTRLVNLIHGDKAESAAAVPYSQFMVSLLDDTTRADSNILSAVMMKALEYLYKYQTGCGAAANKASVNEQPSQFLLSFGLPISDKRRDQIHIKSALAHKGSGVISFTQVC